MNIPVVPVVICVAVVILTSVLPAVIKARRLMKNKDITVIERRDVL